MHVNGDGVTVRSSYVYIIANNLVLPVYIPYCYNGNDDNSNTQYPCYRNNSNAFR